MNKIKIFQGRFERRVEYEMDCFYLVIFYEVICNCYKSMEEMCVIEEYDISIREKFYVF